MTQSDPTFDDVTSMPSTTSEGTASTDPSGSTSSETATATTGEPEADPCEALLGFVDALEAAAEGDRADLIRAWLDAEVYGEHGLPLRCDGALGFVLEDDAGGTLSVAGELNDWDPAADPLTTAVAGTGFHYAIVDVDDPAAGGMYKFVRDGIGFFADPRARRFGWDEFGEFSLTAPRAGEDHHERWPGFEEAVGDLDPRGLVVWVPPNADAAGPLPVLYMHDGQNLFAPDAIVGGWQVGPTARALVDAGDVTPVLVVGIDNTGARFDEYTHTADDLGSGPVGGRASEYAAFVVDGIKPFIDARYDTAAGPDTTAVLGSSLGGLVSLHLGWLHPDVFGAVGSMSGTLGWGSAQGERILALWDASPPTGAIVYLDSGGSGPCPAQGSDNYCENVEMRDTLIAAGWTADADLFYVWDPDAPHNETAWSSRLGPALQQWFPAGPAEDKIQGGPHH